MTVVPESVAAEAERVMASKTLMARVKEIRKVKGLR
jgi:hypothetical protein